MVARMHLSVTLQYIAYTDDVYLFGDNIQCL